MTSSTAHRAIAPDAKFHCRYETVVSDICAWPWARLSRDELTGAAWAYYYFSIQFRENLETARRLHPADPQLLELDRGERNTDNLSPWPGVAKAGEKMHHDEFMRRTLTLDDIPVAKRAHYEMLGQTYLAKVRALDDQSKTLSISSYEDGGLEQLFKAMLTAPHWDTPLLKAFQHFLSEHIRFDSDPDAGHGALCRHLPPDDRVLPLWQALQTIFAAAVPGLNR